MSAIFTEQKHRTNTETDIHASSGNRTHDTSACQGELISSLRPRGHCGLNKDIHSTKLNIPAVASHPFLTVEIIPLQYRPDHKATSRYQLLAKRKSEEKRF
jgi:hypothetical protein